jgi:hypothetical protein
MGRDNCKPNMRSVVMLNVVMMSAVAPCGILF